MSRSIISGRRSVDGTESPDGDWVFKSDEYTREQIVLIRTQENYDEFRSRFGVLPRRGL